MMDSKTISNLKFIDRIYSDETLCGIIERRLRLRELLDAVTSLNNSEQNFFANCGVTELRNNSQIDVQQDLPRFPLFGGEYAIVEIKIELGIQPENVFVVVNEAYKIDDVDDNKFSVKFTAYEGGKTTLEIVEGMKTEVYPLIFMTLPTIEALYQKAVARYIDSINDTAEKLKEALKPYAPDVVSSIIESTQEG